MMLLAFLIGCQLAQSPTAAAGPAAEIKQAFQALKAHLNQREETKAVARGLRPPAPAPALAKLARAVFGKPALPDDLAAWFGCHDGQPEDAPELDLRIAGRLLSAEESLATWTQMGEMQAKGHLGEQWTPEWVPVLTKYNGDLLVWEAGQLRWWWHDDPGRPVQAKSLAAYLRDVVAERERARARAAVVVRVPAALNTENEEMVLADERSAKALAACPAGTVYYERLPLDAKLDEELAAAKAKAKIRELPDADVQRLRDTIARGDRFKAIEWLRENTGWSVKTRFEYVKWLAANPGKRPQPVSETPAEPVRPPPASDGTLRYLYLKLGPDVWARAYSHSTLDATFARLQVLLKEPRIQWEMHDDEVSERLAASTESIARARVEWGPAKK
ncbi:MAG: hypothetical protein QM765_31330 [Myxococcales bacterium]